MVKPLNSPDVTDEVKHRALVYLMFLKMKTNIQDQRGEVLAYDSGGVIVHHQCHNGKRR